MDHTDHSYDDQDNSLPLHGRPEPECAGEKAKETVFECWELPADPAICPELRHRVRNCLAPYPYAVDDAELVIAELFANACRHSLSGDGGRVTVTVSVLHCGNVFLAVDDQGPKKGFSLPSITRPEVIDPFASSGRGLILVHLLADYWARPPRRTAAESGQCSPPRRKNRKTFPAVPGCFPTIFPTIRQPRASMRFATSPVPDPRPKDPRHAFSSPHKLPRSRISAAARCTLLPQRGGRSAVAGCCGVHHVKGTRGGMAGQCCEHGPGAHPSLGKPEHATA